MKRVVSPRSQAFDLSSWILYSFRITVSSHVNGDNDNQLDHLYFINSEYWWLNGCEVSDLDQVFFCVLLTRDDLFLT